MASREFLKILQYARLGDVSAQQSVASAYLTGAFKTPIQPSNALIWFEKSYISYHNQVLNDSSLEGTQTASHAADFSKSLEVLSQIATVPLASTLNSSSFGFGWESFWQLAKLNISERHAAQWQLAELLLDPDKKNLQEDIREWLLKKQGGSNGGLKPRLDSRLVNQSYTDSVETDLLALQKTAKEFLLSLAESNTDFAVLAKELLIKLQPKDETLSSLWKAWVSDQNENALVQAAELGLTVAKLTLGLRLAQPKQKLQDLNNVSTKSNVSLKKAAYWLEMAAKDGDHNAWFSLGEIYRRPQFSGYSAAESDRCFDMAADLGHAQAQLRRGANLWRKREKIEEKVRGLQASYWIWQAHQQGVPEAKELLAKVLENVSNSDSNEWHVLATHSQRVLNHHAEHQLDQEWVLMCHRLIIANQFHLSKAEMLLCEVGQLQHEHCIVVDIRHELPKILPRLIQIDTTQQRRSLLAAGKAFAGSEPEQEGNLRQRRYRFDRLSEWLNTTFSEHHTAD